MLRKLFVGFALKLFRKAKATPITLVERLRLLAVTSSADEVERQMTDETSVFSSKNALWKMAFTAPPRGGGLRLEFGVRDGFSTKQISQALPGHEILYAFDSFLGIRDAWSKPDVTSGEMSMHGQPPREVAGLQNVELVVGWVEDTLPSFLKEHQEPVVFVHLDLDVYPPTKFVLQSLKNRLVEGSILLFDDMFGFVGWKKHSFKATAEVLGFDNLKLVGVSHAEAMYRFAPD